jgi:hypothetical protein
VPIDIDARIYQSPRPGRARFGHTSYGLYDMTATSGSGRPTEAA